MNLAVVSEEEVCSQFGLLCHPVVSLTPLLLPFFISFI